MATFFQISLWNLRNVGKERRPGRFPGMASNSGNHGKDEKLYKSDQMLNQTKRNINKLCLGKISLQKTLRIKFP